MMISEVTAFIRYQKLIGEKRLLEQINAIVSHEMRNPLNSILAIMSKIVYCKDMIMVTIRDPKLKAEIRESIS